MISGGSSKETVLAKLGEKPTKKNKRICNQPSNGQPREESVIESPVQVTIEPGVEIGWFEVRREGTVSQR